jgi:hypothetical protein
VGQEKGSAYERGEKDEEKGRANGWWLGGRGGEERERDLVETSIALEGATVCGPSCPSLACT